jgi:hypothetical protein
MQAVAIYFATFVVACAVNFQYRNAIYGNYIAMGFTSCFISTINLYMLKTIPHVTQFYEGLAYVLGGATGALAATFLHKRFFNK